MSCARLRTVEKVLEALKQFLFPLDIQDDAILVVVKVEC